MPPHRRLIPHHDPTAAGKWFDLGRNNTKTYEKYYEEAKVWIRNRDSAEVLDIWPESEDVDELQWQISNAKFTALYLVSKKQVLEKNMVRAQKVIQDLNDKNQRLKKLVEDLASAHGFSLSDIPDWKAVLAKEGPLFSQTEPPQSPGFPKN